MSEQAVKEWPEIEMWRDPARPDLGLRFGLDFKNPTEGFPELMRYVPQQRVNALVEALEEVQGEIYLWQIGEGPWQGEPTDLIAHLHKVARTALANYKEGEA